MKIEEIAKEALGKAENGEINSLRMRANQIFVKYFKDTGNDSWQGITKAALFENYADVIAEAQRRKIVYKVPMPLDRLVFSAMLKRKLWGIEIENLKDVILTSGYVSIVGKFVEEPRDTQKIEVALFNEDFEGKVRRTINDVVKKETGKSPEFKYPEGTTAANLTHIPLYDLVLKVRKDIKRMPGRGAETTGEGETVDIARCAFCKAEPKWVYAEDESDKHLNVCHKHRLKAREEFNKRKVSPTVVSLSKVKIAKGVIPHKDYGMADMATVWDAGKEVRQADVEKLKKMSTWFDSEKPDVKSSYKLPHHRASDLKAVWRGVTASMGALFGARGGVRLPASDKKGVYNHLSAHYKSFDKEPPEFRKYEKAEIEVEFGIEDDKLIDKIEKAESFDISKPFPNEHAARLQSPGKYDNFRRTKNGFLYGNNIKVPANVSIVWGHPKGKPPRIWVPQSLRFPKDSYTVAQAKKWLGDNKVKYSTFEVAVSKAQILFKIDKIEEPEYIVGGVVYEADTEDTQGDQASAKEIWKAMKKYMIEERKVKIMHKGKARDLPIVECYFSEDDHKKGSGTLKKGTWWMSVFLGNEKDIWKEVEDGTLTGFSMGGQAMEGKGENNDAR